MRKSHIILILVLALSYKGNTQLISFHFDGVGTCPTQGNVVVSPPHTSINSFVRVNVKCEAKDNHFASSGWSTNNTIDTTKYIEVTVSAHPGYKINITGVSFNQLRNNTGPLSGKVAHNASGVFSQSQNFTLTTASSLVTFLTHSPANAVGGSITFRIYGWNASGENGMMQIKDFGVLGSVVVLNQ